MASFHLSVRSFRCKVPGFVYKKVSNHVNKFLIRVEGKIKSVIVEWTEQMKSRLKVCTITYRLTAS